MMNGLIQPREAFGPPQIDDIDSVRPRMVVFSTRNQREVHLEIAPSSSIGDSSERVDKHRIGAGVFSTSQWGAAIEYFPNSSPPAPVPAILTEDEAIRVLRLDEGQRAPEAARRALRRLVETKRLRPARVGLLNRYAREELLRFLRHATELSGDAPDAD